MCFLTNIKFIEQSRKIHVLQKRSFIKPMNKIQLHFFLMEQVLCSFVRHYSIIERYVFPDENKLKTPQQLAQVRFEQSLFYNTIQKHLLNIIL